MQSLLLWNNFILRWNLQRQNRWIKLIWGKYLSKSSFFQSKRKHRHTFGYFCSALLKRIMLFVLVVSESSKKCFSKVLILSMGRDQLSSCTSASSRRKWNKWDKFGSIEWIYLLKLCNPHFGEKEYAYPVPVKYLTLYPNLLDAIAH